MSVPEVNVNRAADLVADGAPLVDVRQVEEFDEVHAVGALLIPLDQVAARIAEFPRDRAVYLICRSGARSARAAEYLRAQGVDAVNVAGGTNAWVAAGLPVGAGA